MPGRNAVVIAAELCLVHNCDEKKTLLVKCFSDSCPSEGNVSPKSLRNFFPTHVFSNAAV